MPDDAQARYRRDAAQQLLVGEGWRLLLAYVVQQLSYYDRVIYRPGLHVAEHEQMLGAHNALTGLVKYVCEQAGVDNPFDVHRQALWSSVEPRHPPEPPGPPGGAADDSEAAKAALHARMAKRRGGGPL